MAKIRIGVLAKELNLKVGDAVARLRELGVTVKSNLSSIDEKDVARLRLAAKGGKGSAAASRTRAADAPARKPVAAKKTATPHKVTAAKKAASAPSTAATRTKGAAPRRADAAAAKKSTGGAAAPAPRTTGVRKAPEAMRPRTTNVPAAAIKGPGVVRQPVSRFGSSAAAARSARPVSGATPAGARTPVTGAHPPIPGQRSTPSGVRQPLPGSRPLGPVARAPLPGPRPTPGTPRPASAPATARLPEQSAKGVTQPTQHTPETRPQAPLQRTRPGPASLPPAPLWAGGRLHADRAAGAPVGSRRRRELPPSLPCLCRMYSRIWRSRRQ